MPTPWWPDVGPVVAEALDRYGIDVTVLRLLHATGPEPHGGAVTSPAEVTEPPPGDGLQRAGCGGLARIDELAAAGVPDRRGTKLAEVICQALAGHGADRPLVARALAELPERLAAAADCGLPDTLVHGDLHPGNLRVGGGRRVVLDWGDRNGR